MTRAPLRLATPLLAAVVLLAACSSTPPQESRYQLDTPYPAAAAPSAPRFNDTLKVMLPNAPGELGGSRFIYRETDQRYTRDPYRGYTSPLPFLLADRITDWIGRSGLFSHVIPSRSPWPSRYVLESDVDALYVDLRPGQPRTAHVQLGFRVRDTTDNRFVYDGQISASAPLAEPVSGDSIATAQAQALTQALSQLETALRSAPVSAQ